MIINPIQEIYLMEFRKQDRERKIKHIQLLKEVERTKPRNENPFKNKVNGLLHVLTNLRKVRVEVSFVYGDNAGC